MLLREVVRFARFGLTFLLGRTARFGLAFLFERVTRFAFLDTFPRPVFAAGYGFLVTRGFMLLLEVAACLLSLAMPARRSMTTGTPLALCFAASLGVSALTLR